MISMLFAAVRLAGVLAVVMWLPGLIASARPLFPLRLLHTCVLGAFVHVLALVLTASVVSSTSSAVWLLPFASIAVSLVVRAIVKRVAHGFPAWDPPTLNRRSAIAVAVPVLIAGMLRWFHNFHYDDLQHLLYLTEIGRENQLFPSQFLLELTPLPLPLVGQGSLLISRYPYWAVSCTLLARLAGVSAGDAYLLIGLGLLALTLGQMVALASQAWSTRIGILWGYALIAASPFVNDNLLNYGGYPFQSGKLFILLAATSTATAWVTRRPQHLLGAVAGLFVGPLLHTNNLVGAAYVFAMLAALAYWSPPLRRPAVLTLCSGALLVVCAVSSPLTSGFLRWEPRHRLVRQADIALDANAAASAATATAARPAGQAPPKRTRDARNRTRDNVFRRIGLFLDRGAPHEVFPALIAVVLLSWMWRYHAALNRLAAPGVVAGLAIMCGVSGIELVRAIVTSTFKPGYYSMRAELRAVTPFIDSGRPLVTDPITDVFGRAAGWSPPDRPALDTPGQATLFLLQHPAVRGAALTPVVASLEPSTLVVNERVVGDGAAAKFIGQSQLNLVGQTVGRDEAEADPQQAIAQTLDEATSHGVGAALSGAPALARTLAHALFDPRRIAVFSKESEPRPLDLATLGSRIREQAPEPPAAEQKFLSSELLTMDQPEGCTSALDLVITNESSFWLTMTVLPLDPVFFTPGAGVTTLTSGPEPVELRFNAPVCEGGRRTFLLHGDYWWDARFTVDAHQWRAAPERGWSAQ